jgi:hypothetical protein
MLQIKTSSTKKVITFALLKLAISVVECM